MISKRTVAASVGTLAMLLPATALASGAGTEVEIGLSLMFAPVALLLLVVQGVVYKVVDSVSARKTVGWVTLVLGVLVGGPSCISSSKPSCGTSPCHGRSPRSARWW